MKRQHTQQAGFSIVEVLLAVVVVLVLGGSGYLVYHAHHKPKAHGTNAQNSTTDKQKTASSTDNSKTAKQPADPYAGWSTYCSDSGGMCFKYPATSGWTETETTDVTTVANPSKSLEVVYKPNVDGIGGACPTGCVFTTEAITPLSATNKLGLETIKGVFTNKPAGSIVPYYFLASPDKMAHYNLQLNQTVGVSFFADLFTSPVDSSQLEQLSVQGTPAQSFSTTADAGAWLAQADTVTAEQIVNSAYVK